MLNYVKKTILKFMYSMVPGINSNLDGANVFYTKI